jgi:hypothetical protein
MYLLPALSYENLENMTLLEIDERVSFILEVKRDTKKHQLKDLSTIIFYGVYYGYGKTQTKKIKEDDFHKTIDKLLNISYDSEHSNQNPKSVESELKSIFG